jgi:hypothetical protein
MNPYDGHRLYQVQRTKTRAEILADDARRGRQAAAVSRGRGAQPRLARHAGPSISASRIDQRKRGSDG